MRATSTRVGKFVLGGLLGTALAAAVALGGLYFLSDRQAKAGAAPVAAAPPSAPAPRPARVDADTIDVPPDVVRALGVRTAAVVPAARPRPLTPFPGCLALDGD